MNVSQDKLQGMVLKMSTLLDNRNMILSGMVIRIYIDSQIWDEIKTWHCTGTNWKNHGTCIRGNQLRRKLQKPQKVANFFLGLFKD